MRMMIRTATQQDIVRKSGGYRPFVLRATRARWTTVRAIDWTVDAVQGLKGTSSQTPEPAVAAYVLRSNWVARCPDCPEVMVVEPGEPFFCPNCLNAANGGRARAVIFPAERAEIERLLLKRPAPENRNWLIGEPVEHLRAENAAHGLED